MLFPARTRTGIVQKGEGAVQAGTQLDFVVSHWLDIGTFTISEIKGGTSGGSYLVTARDGTFVLRQLRSATAAMQEYEISRLLSDMGIAAAIHPTRQGSPFLQVRDSCFNLQSFLPGCAPDLSDRAAVAAAANSLAAMQQRLETCDLTVLDSDRFHTMSLWERSKSQAPLFAPFFPPDCTVEAMEATIRHAENTMGREQIIHGDLGSWNMLWDQKRIHFIDFGECRLGDYSFDIAAIMASILRAAPDGPKQYENLDLFLRTYEEQFHPVDRARLQTAVWLWLLRGALAVCVFTAEPQRKELLIRRFLCDLDKFRHWSALFSGRQQA